MKERTPQTARLSSRKKIKKTLGPDFLDPSKLGSHVNKSNSEVRCDQCHNSHSLNGRKDLISCKRCSFKIHLTCMQDNLDFLKYKKTNWLCLKCRLCSLCGEKAYEREQLTYCDICHDSYHIECSRNIFFELKGKWVCQDCQFRKVPMRRGNSRRGTTESFEVKNEMAEKMVAQEEAETPDEEIKQELVSNPESCKEDKPMETLSTESNCSINTFEDETSSNIKMVESAPDESNENSEKAMYEPKDNPVRNQSGADKLKLKLFEKACKVADLLPANTSDWSMEDVEHFIRFIGFPDEAKNFREQDIDGKSLLLLTRSDVLNGFSIKLGPAVKIYAHINQLQTTKG